MRRFWMTGALLTLSACGPPMVDISFDSDEDGLLDVEEEEFGTDPSESDTDGDGYTDGEEVDANTLPDDETDHPYTGGWPIDDCRWDIEGTGTEVGDIAFDFELADQYNEVVSLHDFCDHTVHLIYGEDG